MSVQQRQGELEATSLARLLMDLYAARFGGALTLSRERVRKTFLLRKGVPFHAESNLGSETLCARMLDSDRLSREEHGRVLDFARRESCHEARALLALGLMDHRTLFAALKELLRARMVECFAWPAGRFELDPTAPLPEGSEALGVDPYAVVQEGIEIHWSPERILADLSPCMAQYPRGTMGLARVMARLRRDDQTEALLAALDGDHSLWQLLQRAGSGRALAAAWVLDASGVLHYAEEPTRDGREAEKSEIEIVVGRPSAPPERIRSEAPRPSRARTPDAARYAQLSGEIREQFARLEDSDHYQVLGVGHDADADTLKHAYMNAARRYHPDVLSQAGLEAELKSQATRLFAEIAKAYATLSDPERRRQYDATLEIGGEEVDVERLASAEGLFRKAEVLMRSGNFRGALEFLEPAVELWPAEASYQAALGWALYKKTPSEPGRALEHLERAEEIDPGEALVQSRLGAVRRALGLDPKA